MLEYFERGAKVISFVTFRRKLGASEGIVRIAGPAPLAQEHGRLAAATAVVQCNDAAFPAGEQTLGIQCVLPGARATVFRVCAQIFVVVDIFAPLIGSELVEEIGEDKPARGASPVIDRNSGESTRIQIVVAGFVQVDYVE